MSIKLKIQSKYKVRKNPFIEHVVITGVIVDHSRGGQLVYSGVAYISYAEPMFLKDKWFGDGTEVDLWHEEDLVDEIESSGSGGGGTLSFLHRPTPQNCPSHDVATTGFSFSYCRVCDGKMRMNKDTVWVLDTYQPQAAICKN